MTTWPPREQADGDRQTALCALVCSEDLSLVYRLKRALDARGLEAFVMGDPSAGARPGQFATRRLMVRTRDLAYARWVASAAGEDAWPH